MLLLARHPVSLESIFIKLLARFFFGLLEHSLSHPSERSGAACGRVNQLPSSGQEEILRGRKNERVAGRELQLELDQALGVRVRPKQEPFTLCEIVPL